MSESEAVKYVKPRKKGFEGDVNASKISARESVVLIRETRPMHLQFFVGLFVVALMIARGLIWGMHFYGVVAVVIVHGIGLITEGQNSVHERTGDAVGEIKNGDPRIEDELVRRIKDGGSGVVMYAFLLAFAVDLMVLIHG